MKKEERNRMIDEIIEMMKQLEELRKEKQKSSAPPRVNPAVFLAIKGTLEKSEAL